MVGYWPCSVCDFVDLDFVSVHERAKKALDQSRYLALTLGQ